MEIRKSRHRHRPVVRGRRRRRQTPQADRARLAAPAGAAVQPNDCHRILRHSPSRERFRATSRSRSRTPTAVRSATQILSAPGLPAAAAELIPPSQARATGRPPMEEVPKGNKNAPAPSKSKK